MYGGPPQSLDEVDGCRGDGLLRSQVPALSNVLLSRLEPPKSHGALATVQAEF